MLKGLTTTFKNKCNATEVVLSEYLVLGNQTIPIKAKLDDDSYENGNFVGTFILKKIEFETDATYDFKDKEFEYYKKIDNESIKIGTFITTEVTINDSQDLVKVVGMDYGLKTQVEYTSSLDYASGTITLKDVWDEACTLSGLESGINDFANSDFIVDSDQFTGTGATIRDVFKGIAMSSGTFVKVMNDDKIYLIFNELTSELKNLEINGSATIQDGYKLNSLELNGNTTQDGTPTPSSPVEIEVGTGGQDIVVEGKNLLGLQKGKTDTVNDVDITITEDGYVKLNGTASANINKSYNWAINGSTYSPQQYTYSSNYVSGTASNNFVINARSGETQTSTSNQFNSSSLYINDTLRTTTFTPSGSGYITGIQFIINSGVTFNNFIVKLQIEKGTATEYEAYKGQNYEVNLGKNLWNSTFYQRAGSTNRLDTVAFRVEPNTTYTFSTGTSNIQIYNYYQDINKNLISSVGWKNTPYTYTTPNNCYYISMSARKTDDSNLTPSDITDIQLERGSQATPYSPYFTPIELCKIGDYKDKIYKSGGKWYIEKQIGKVVLDGSENWVKASTTTVDRFSISYNVGSNTLLSNYFVGSTSWVATVGTIMTNTDKNKLAINYSTYGTTDLATFKTWLSTHNTIIYYILATPTITEITNTELISQLESIKLLEGLNNITISSNDLPSPLKITYYNNELDIIEDYTDLEDKRDTHPWTCLRLGMSQIDGENVDYIDEELVEQYGENWLILNDNPFAYNQTKRQQLIMNIFNQIKEFGYSSFSSKTSFKPYLTCGDLIKFKNRDGNLVNSIVLRYDHDYENITIEAPSETSATVNYIYPLSAIDVAKRTQIEVDKEQGQITSLVETTTNLNTRTTKNETDINNNYQEIIGKFNDVASVDDVTQLRQAMQTTMTEQELRIENIQSALDGGVEKVTTTSGTFDENGLTMEKTGAKTKGVFDESGLDIQDAQGSSNQDLLFAGYVDSDKAQSNQDLTPYEGQTVVYTKNIIVKNYLTIGTHSRIEDYEDGTGVFYIGG